MRESAESDSDFEVEGMPEVERRDLLKMSEFFYDRGRERMREGKILDGLIDLHLARDHLVGRFAPHGIRQNRRLEKTLGELEPAIKRAQAELRLYGPVKPTDGSNGSEVDVDSRD